MLKYTVHTHKLVAFSPRFFLHPTAKKKLRWSNPLEACLRCETAETVLENLLSITDSDIGSLCSMLERNVSTLQELWQLWAGRGEEESEGVCAVMVRVFVEMVMSVVGAGEEVTAGMRDFALSSANHSELYIHLSLSLSLSLSKKGRGEGGQRRE